MLLQVAAAQYLAAAVDGLAYSESTDEGNVFVDRLPTTPDRCVAVFGQAAGEPDSLLPYDPVQLVIVVRGDSSPTWAMETWELIYDALHGLRNQNLSGVYVAWVIATEGQPMPLAADQNGRRAYSSTFRAEVIRPTANRSAL
jgi:hypothetical protein